MRQNKHLCRILNKGGVLSPAHLSLILNIAEDAGNKHVYLGSRQDILFNLPEGTLQNKPAGPELSIHKRNSGVQNIVSSYVCVDILSSTDWVHAGTYLHVLDRFTTNHRLRVNIVDPQQNLVPLFYGHLNFIASEMPNYWHLFLNLEQDKDPCAWPGMIFTDDIADFAREMEEHITGSGITDYRTLVEVMKTSLLQQHTLESSSGIKLPPGFFPDYEGLNKMEGKDQYWAGFYWRNNCYPVQFLKEVCQLCLNTNIGKISFTPWKTFLIKDIGIKDKVYWDELIGRHGINMRHSSFELNWHLPLLDRQALELKRYLVSEFDKVDIRVSGLSFAIQLNGNERFTTIVIRPEGRLPVLGKFDFTRTYSIGHAYNFNPNANHFIEYATGLGKGELPKAISELTKRYYSLLSLQSKTVQIRGKAKAERNYRQVHLCPVCLTVYDVRYGDMLAGIPAGVLFDQLPDSYCCQVCETPRSAFCETEILEPAFANP